MAKRALSVLLNLFLAAGAMGAIPSTQPGEPWVNRSPEDWPQLVLTNDAAFVGHTALRGASSFLIRMPDGEVVLGTAKHLIHEAGGVKPPIRLADLDGCLQTWRAFPRTMEDRSIEVRGLEERSNGETFHDWLLLGISDQTRKLPSTPLVPRTEPVQAGETVYLVGVSYSDESSPQRVYKGVVTARPKDHYFTYDFEPPVRIAGFSGAPIVDAKGLLVGHGVSKSQTLKQRNGLEVEFGGEDASLAVDLWKHRHDGAVTKPSEVIHLQLPDGWTARKPPSDKVLYFAQDESLIAFFEVLAEPKADFSEDTDLMKWAELVKINAARSAKVPNRSETDLRAGKIGERSTVEYEFSQEAKNLMLRYRIVMFECNGCFCKVACWTLPSHWDEAQPKFEEIVKAVH